MTDFNTMIKNDARAMIIALGGELLTYKRSNGAQRDIYIIVHRNPPATYGADGSVIIPAMTITAVNDAMDGIDTSTMDPNGADKIHVAERIGGTAQDYGLYLPKGGIRTNDNGMISLELR